MTELRDRHGRTFRTEKSRVGTNWFKQIVGRFWYLMIPPIAIMFAKDAYVRPHLVKNENTINLARVATDQFKDSLLADVRVIDGEQATVQAAIDSTAQPQVLLYRSVLDSLLVVRREYDAVLPAAQGAEDSLNLVLGEIRTELQSASTELQQKQQMLDGLRDYRRTMSDSVEILTGEIQELADVFDRLANPDDYRKNTALVPGPGNYPNRDELPER